MKQFHNRCGNYRERICLLASGALTREEGVEVERHLIECSGCREYAAEVRGVTEPLINLQKPLSQLEPSDVARTRWAKDFETAMAPIHSESKLRVMMVWLVDVLRPQRRIWAGFAAVWLAIFALNFTVQDPPSSSRPAAGLVRALLESEGFVARTSKTEGRPIESPKRSSTTIRENRES